MTVGPEDCVQCGHLAQQAGAVETMGVPDEDVSRRVMERMPGLADFAVASLADSGRPALYQYVAFRIQRQGVRRHGHANTVRVGVRAIRFVCHGQFENPLGAVLGVFRNRECGFGGCWNVQRRVGPTDSRPAICKGTELVVEATGTIQCDQRPRRYRLVRACPCLRREARIEALRSKGLLTYYRHRYRRVGHPTAAVGYPIVKGDRPRRIQGRRIRNSLPVAVDHGGPLRRRRHDPIDPKRVAVAIGVVGKDRH